MQRMISDIYSITIPIPFRLRTVNVYLIKDHDGYILIDTGPYTEEALELLEGKVAISGVSWEDIHTVLITHYHCEHCGLAAEIERRSGASIFMSHEDYEILNSFCENPKRVLGIEELHIYHGMPITLIEEIAQATLLAARFNVSICTERILQ